MGNMIVHMGNMSVYMGDMSVYMGDMSIYMGDMSVYMGDMSTSMCTYMRVCRSYVHTYVCTATLTHRPSPSTHTHRERCVHFYRPTHPLVCHKENEVSHCHENHDHGHPAEELDVVMRLVQLEQRFVLS